VLSVLSDTKAAELSELSDTKAVNPERAGVRGVERAGRCEGV
jgi:hypothetical protein